MRTGFTRRGTYAASGCVARPPNILWIVTTQWRAQALGQAGDPNARTPALDAMANQGINYTQAVTPHPFGPFARAALLTGVRSPENGVRDYFDPLPTASRTIAHTLGERGYRTGFFGKWHLGERDATAPLVGEAHARQIIPEEARGGFQHWEGFESGFLLNDPWLHGTDLQFPKQFVGYQGDVVCARAQEWMDRQATGLPWFSLVSLEPPHPPYDAPAAGIPRRAPGTLVLAANVPRGGEVEARARRELAGYYAHLEATDRAIGRLLETLPESTVVVFTSVHGDMHGAHGYFRKGWPYEESIRVPLIVRGAPADDPTRCKRTSLEPVSLVDLSAMTLAWAAGEAWRCPRTEADISMPSVVRLPHQCDRVWSGRRSPTRKTVWNADGSPWLEFDLAEDPGETRNLAER